MDITIKHRCGHETTAFASHKGGYVFLTSPVRPGTLGQQPTDGRGNTLTCGPSEESLRRVVYSHLKRGIYHGDAVCGNWNCDGKPHGDPLCAEHRKNNYQEEHG